MTHDGHQSNNNIFVKGKEAELTLASGIKVKGTIHLASDHQITIKDKAGQLFGRPPSEARLLD